MAFAFCSMEVYMADNYITINCEKGSLNVSEEVAGSIIRSAVLDVEGVAGINGAAGADIAEFIGKKALSKGIRLKYEDGQITCDVIINVSYGSNVIEVAENVQNAVHAELLNMTSLEDIVVNVNVAGIAF